MFVREPCAEVARVTITKELKAMFDKFRCLILVPKAYARRYGFERWMVEKAAELMLAEIRAQEMGGLTLYVSSA